MAVPPLRQVGITLEKALQPEQILHHLPFAGRCPSFHQQTLQHRVYILLQRLGTTWSAKPAQLPSGTTAQWEEPYPAAPDPQQQWGAESIGADLL